MSLPPSNPPVSKHERDVQAYYDMTQDFYLKAWHPEHIHFGVFEPGECPEEGKSIAESRGFTRALERMIDLIVAPAGIEKGHHVVDAGCGVGGTSIYLAKTLGCTVTGVSITESQLEIASGKAAAADLSGSTNFVWADCSQRLPFADASIDAVVNIESACHYSDRGQFLREVHRILKPGGRIGTMDWMVPDGLPAADYEEHIQPVCDAWRVHSLESQATYARKLRAAGLEVLEFEDFDGKDQDNLQLLTRGLHFRFFTLFCGGGQDFQFIREQIAMLTTLCSAWKGGHFVLKRYCAKKSEKV